MRSLRAVVFVCALLVCACSGWQRPAVQASIPSARTLATSESRKREPVAAQLADVARVQALELQTAFGSYRGQGAVWVAGQRLAVNREYDFGIALGVPDLGPAVAAGARLDANRALAAQLATAGWNTTLDARLRNVAAQPGMCAGTGGSELYVYALLFGTDHARLQMMLEIRRSGRSTLYLAQVSAEHPLAGSDSWTTSDAALLPAEVAAGASALLGRCAELVELADSSAPLAASQQRCSVGGKEILAGHLARTRDGQPVLIVKDPTPMLVLCSPEIAAPVSAR
jgi:hypothetical protein